MSKITVGLSPCPNDTFIFHALLNGLTPIDGVTTEPVFEDVEQLNRLARSEELDVTKISFHAFGHLRKNYRLLRAGSALGRGCGPLIVCRPEARDRDLAECRVAIPGQLTSANLLLRLFAPQIRLENLEEMVFDEIMTAVENGTVDAGLIIHESRFTYAQHGLVSRQDLGEWWEETHGHPIPLGGIIAHRRLGDDLIARFDAALRRSVQHAFAHPEASKDYIRDHAQEMDAQVTRAHIELYVNQFSLDLGDEGQAAVDHLLGEAERLGVVPRV